jgi:hypothetical protein
VNRPKGRGINRKGYALNKRKNGQCYKRLTIKTRSRQDLPQDLFEVVR